MRNAHPSRRDKKEKVATESRRRRFSEESKLDVISPPRDDSRGINSNNVSSLA